MSGRSEVNKECQVQDELRKQVIRMGVGRRRADRKTSDSLRRNIGTNYIQYPEYHNKHHAAAGLGHRTRRLSERSSGCRPEVGACDVALVDPGVLTGLWDGASLDPLVVFGCRESLECCATPPPQFTPR